MAGEFDPKKLIVDFAKDNEEIAALQFIRDDPDGIHFKLDEGNGVINYVYRVQSADNKSSVILKYAEETARCIPDEKVSLDRQVLEYNCLCLLHNNIQPGSVPEPYCLDQKHHILAMADMSDWELLGVQLEDRRFDLEAASDLGRVLGKMHRGTSKDNLSKEGWEQFQTKFHQDDGKEYIRLFTLIRPFTVGDSLNKIAQENQEAHQRYSKDFEHLGFQQKITDLFNEQTCFIHGDCHYKSIFVKDGRAAIFDFEFAFLGHPAFNVSFPVGCYAAAILYDEKHVTKQELATGMSVKEFRTSCLTAIRNILEAYFDIHKDISKSEESKTKFISDLALFTAAIVFTAGTFAQIELIIEGITDEDRGRMMDAGFRIMKGHDKVKTVDDFIDLISPN